MRIEKILEDFETQIAIVKADPENHAAAREAFRLLKIIQMHDVRTGRLKPEKATVLVAPSA